MKNRDVLVRIITLGLIWSLLSYQPFMNGPLFWYSGLSFNQMMWCWSAAVSWSIGEVAGLCTLLLFIDWTSNRHKVPYNRSRIFYTIAYALIVIYILLIGISHYLYYYTRVFLGINHIKAFTTGTMELIKHTPLADIAAAMLAFFIAIIIMVLFAKFRPHYQEWKGVVSGLLVTLILFYVPVSILTTGLSTMYTPQEAQLTKNFALNMFSPSLHLVLNPLLHRFDYLTEQELGCIDAENSSKIVHTPRNVVLLIVEALSADVLTRDDIKKAMPHLRGMANSGVSMQRAYASSSESNYSSVAILTGMHPLKRFWRDTYTDIDVNYFPLYEYLPQESFVSGYFTSHSENWQNVDRIIRTPGLNFFSDSTADRYLDNLEASFALHGREGLHAQQVHDARMVQNFLKWTSKLPTDKKYFARLFFNSSHYPFYSPPPEFELFKPNIIPKGLNLGVAFTHYPLALTPYMYNRYLNSLRYIDHLIWYIKSELARMGHARDTVIIVVGDHGELFGTRGLVNHAGDLLEQVMKVAFVIDGAPELNRIDPKIPVSHIDIAPTILTFAGVSPPSRMQGRSLQSISSQDLDRPIFSSIQSIADQDVLITWPYKLRHNNFTGKNELTNLASNPEENHLKEENSMELRECLAEALKAFRLRQLSYYSLSREYRTLCAPPQHDQLTLRCTDKK